MVRTYAVTVAIKAVVDSRVQSGTWDALAGASGLYLGAWGQRAWIDMALMSTGRGWG